jgi:hypothetical protein
VTVKTVYFLFFSLILVCILVFASLHPVFLIAFPPHLLDYNILLLSLLSYMLKYFHYPRSIIFRFISYLYLLSSFLPYSFPPLAEDILSFLRILATALRVFHTRNGNWQIFYNLTYQFSSCYINNGIILHFGYFVLYLIPNFWMWFLMGKLCRLK